MHMVKGFFLKTIMLAILVSMTAPMTLKAVHTADVADVPKKTWKAWLKEPFNPECLTVCFKARVKLAIGRSRLIVRTFEPGQHPQFRNNRDDASSTTTVTSAPSTPSSESAFRVLIGGTASRALLLRGCSTPLTPASPVH